jgi:hypothetical protein
MPPSLATAVLLVMIFFCCQLSALLSIIYMAISTEFGPLMGKVDIHLYLAEQVNGGFFWGKVKMAGVAGYLAVV